MQHSLLLTDNSQSNSSDRYRLLTTRFNGTTLHVFGSYRDSISAVEYLSREVEPRIRGNAWRWGAIIEDTWAKNDKDKGIRESVHYGYLKAVGASLETHSDFVHPVKVSLFEEDVRGNVGKESGLSPEDVSLFCIGNYLIHHHGNKSNLIDEALNRMKHSGNKEVLLKGLSNGRYKTIEKSANIAWFRRSISLLEKVEGHGQNVLICVDMESIPAFLPDWRKWR